MEAAEVRAADQGRPSVLTIPRAERLPAFAESGWNDSVRLLGKRITIACENWPEPASASVHQSGRWKPRAELHAVHDGAGLALLFQVEEDGVRASTDEAQGPVWQDSCVEFFCSVPLLPRVPLVAQEQPGGPASSLPKDSATCYGNSSGRPYWNFEFNCIGTCLCALGAGRQGRLPLGPEGLLSILTRASLGSKAFGFRPGVCRWTLAVYIPAALLGVENLGGMRSRSNFYKCGDKLPEPHYYSWQAVKTPTPDFHRPEYFSELAFA